MKLNSYIFNKERNDTQDHLKALLRMEVECFPKEWHYEDAPEFYESKLNSSNSLIVFLQNSEDQEICGFILCVPLQEVFDELKKSDSEIILSDGQYYMEGIAILSKYRGQGGLEIMLKNLHHELSSRNISSVSIHARTTNKLDRNVKRLFLGKLVSERAIASWEHGGGEPYEFLEFKL